MDVKIKIKNLPQIRSAFMRSPRIMARNLNQAIRNVVVRIEGDSRRNTPVRTGFLRASHNSRFGNLEGVIDVKADYAPFVHFGTRFQRAQPFLQRAVDENENYIDKKFKEAVDDTLTWIARHAP